MTIPNTDAVALRSQPFTMRYDAMTVTHTTQFVLCASDEQLVLECSSGLITGDDVPTLPIHSRLALPWTAATRLHELLDKALQGQTARGADRHQGPAAGEMSTQRTARLPRFETSHD